MKFSLVTINSAPTTSDYAMGVTAGGVDYRMTNAVLAALMHAVANIPSGRVIQEVVYLDATQLNVTGTIPFDDTIPQITEASQILSTTYTPALTGSTLEIEVLAQLYTSSGTTQNVGFAVFNGGANAIAAQSTPIANGGTGLGGPFCLRGKMTTTSTSPLTISVRAGSQISGTLSLNGIGSGRFFGGVMQSSIRITEIKP